eukprot:CAMPEP_0181103920 /NCGR_PEP_ID=MMETSP1071-20121207/15142_1 /TAXON_ID=35127 /ORGANISM="Thalassiosira sp., Strain NH16" /LENGTH=379 /DNA_ID=CAMNT_0023187065 /DNA_START=64 /DNA_END=1204 /DNA_ORIENTATION=-
MDLPPAATLNRRQPPELSHCPQLSRRFLALLIVSFVALLEVMVHLPQQGEVTPNAYLTSQLLRDNGSSGSTGERFSGNKVRTYRGRHFQFQEIASQQQQQQSIFGPDLTPNCVKWAVVTTIHKPNESIFGVSKLKNWCLVIVGDTITPLAKYEELAMEEGVFFLSASYQTQHLASNPFISIMPFKSFARKNVGYLFAVTYGAKVIYDFDDDNILKSLEDNVTVPPPFFYRADVGFDKTTLLHFVESREQSEDSPAFNPYEFWEQVTNILGRGVSPLTPPIVKHERTDHDYLADFEAEHNLYGKTTALLKFLDGWTSAAKTLPEKLSDLWIALYEHDFIGLLDVEAMEEWIKFLLGIGYEFPIPNTDESLISDWRRVVSS